MSDKYRALLRIDPPYTQSMLMCPYCLNRQQPRKSHKAASYKAYHTRTLLILSCKTCRRKLIAPLTKKGIQAQELSQNVTGVL